MANHFKDVAFSVDTHMTIHIVSPQFSWEQTVLQSSSATRALILQVRGRSENAYNHTIPHHSQLKFAIRSQWIKDINLWNLSAHVCMSTWYMAILTERTCRKFEELPCCIPFFKISQNLEQQWAGRNSSLLTYLAGLKHPWLSQSRQSLSSQAQPAPSCLADT